MGRRNLCWPTHRTTNTENLKTGSTSLFFVQAEDGIRYHCVTGVQTCALPIFAKKRPACFADHVFFSIDDHLRYLLADHAKDAAPRRLQFGELCLNNVGLLATLEALAALPNPFLAFEDQIGKLISNFEGKKLQQSEAKKQVDFDVLVKFCLGHRALHEVGEQLAESSVVRALDGAQLGAGDIRAFGVLPDEVK